MPTPALAPDALRAALEAAGRRCTRQRLAVYEALAAAEHHPTAEEVCEAVRRDLPDISLATVYKALEAFVADGLAAKLAAAATARRGTTHAATAITTSAAWAPGAWRICRPPSTPTSSTSSTPASPTASAMRGFLVTGYRLELLGRFEGDAS